MSVLLRQGNLVYPHPRGVERADLLIEGEKISRVEKWIDTAALPPKTRIVDASPYLVFPGFIDAHTHYGVGEGVGRSADGWYEGTAAAAYGGISTCIDFSDQLPGLSLAKGAELRIREAERDALVDFALHQGLYRLHEKIPKELDGLKAAGVSAVKIFSTYKHLGLYLDPEGWNTLFPLCREKELLLTIHAEDEEIIEAAASKYPDDGLGPEMHPILRPSRAEAAAVLAAGLKAGEFGMPLYIVHISSKETLDVIEKLRRGGVRLVAETVPHYLYLTEEKLHREDGYKFLMTPPLRSDGDREALRAAVYSGVIDIVATDHCAFSAAQKRKAGDCRRVPAGIPGSGEVASLLYTLLLAGGSAAAGDASGTEADSRRAAEALVKLLSYEPARVFGLYPRKGSLEVGSDADITLFDPEAEGVFSSRKVRTKAGYTPYEGIRYRGSAVSTFVRGTAVVEDGFLRGRRGYGTFVRGGKPGVYGEAAGE